MPFLFVLLSRVGQAGTAGDPEATLLYILDIWQQLFHQWTSFQLLYGTHTVHL